MLKWFDFIRQRAWDTKTNLHGVILAKMCHLTRQLVVLDRLVAGGILVKTSPLVTKLLPRENYRTAQPICCSEWPKHTTGIVIIAIIVKLYRWTLSNKKGNLKYLVLRPDRTTPLFVCLSKKISKDRMGITPNLKKLLTLLHVPNFLPILKGKTVPARYWFARDLFIA